MCIRDRIQIVKEEIFEPQFEKFEAPVFANNEAQEVKKSSPVPIPPSSAFSRAVGFRNVTQVENNNNVPIFDTTQLNKAFSSNMAGSSFNHE